MNFLRMSAKNFMSFQDLSFEFDSGIQVVRGENLDEFSSNGSGKTTFIELPYWILFASQLRKGSGPVRDGEKSCSASLVFEMFEKEYTITRTAKASTTGTEVSISENGVDISKATTTLTNKLIEDIIGMDPDIFRSLVVFGGGQDSFATLTDTSKKTIFNRILKIDEWEGYRKVALAKLDQQKKEVTAAKTQVDVITALIEADEKRFQAVEQELLQAKPPEPIKTLPQDLADAEYELNALSLREKDLVSKLATQQVYHDEINSKRANLSVIQSEINSLEQDLIQVEGQYKKRVNQQLLFESGKCPTCFQVVDAGSDHLSEWIQETAQLKAKAQQLKVRVEDKKAACIGLSDSIRQLEHILKTDYRKLERELKAEQNRLLLVVADLNNAEARFNTKMAEYKAYVKSLEKQLDDMEVNLKLKEVELKEATTILNRQILIKDCLSECEKMFGKSGIQSTILREIEGPINTYLSQYMNDMGYKYTSLELKTQRQLKNGELKDEIDIKILKDSGIQKSYFDMSEGEKRRIDLVFFLTLLSLYEMSGSVNLIVYDEVLDRIDKEGADCLFQVLKTHFGDKCVLVTTPTDNLDWRADRYLTVTKQGGVSCLRQ